MKSINYVLVGLTSLLALQAHAKEVTFKDYTVKLYNGKKSPINYNSHQYAKAFKTLIQQSYQSPNPDFAGSYNTVSWGCGTACVNYAMIDRRTGNVYALADLAYRARKNAKLTCTDLALGSNITTSEFLSKKDSRLMIEHEYCGTDDTDVYLDHYLLWDDKTKSFKLLDQKFNKATKK